MDRYDIVSKSIANQHYLIHASNFDEACHVMNTIAPEHASIQTVNPQPYIEKVKYVGALFIGHYSPEVIGDYVAGQVMYYLQIEQLDLPMGYRSMIS